MPWVRYTPNEKKSKDREKNFSNNAIVKVTGGSIGDCNSTPVAIEAVRTGSVIKVPVVLAELTLPLNIDATIDLPLVAGEVIDIKNSLKVSQCKLLPKTNTLFVKGYINQTIEYKPINYNFTKIEAINQCDIEIPYSCTTSVDYNGGEPLDPIPNDSKTLEYGSQLACDINQADESSEESIEKNRINTENFNDLPYCQLISSNIFQIDRYLNYKNNVSKDKFIKKIEEKIVIRLTIKILQNQQIEVSPMALRAVSDS